MHFSALHSLPARRALARCSLLAALLPAGLAAIPAHAEAPAPAVTTQRFETRFMGDMIDHHAMAVHMGTLCLAKAVHPELRALCENIVTTQRQEIATLTQWLQAWYGVPHRVHHHGEMPAGHEVGMDKLAALNQAEFEINFMEQMIRHHRMAVVKGSQCVARAHHVPLQNLCEDMVSAQLAEIRQMQTWLCQWYGRCRRPA